MEGASKQKWSRRLLNKTESESSNKRRGVPCFLNPRLPTLKNKTWQLSPFLLSLLRANKGGPLTPQAPGIF